MPEIREPRQEDWPAIAALYPRAFAEEDLVSLVRDLVAEGADGWSLVGTIDAQIVAHIHFAKCGVADRSLAVALLGPLAVDPAWQKRGIGTALVRAGLQRVSDDGVGVVLVLGDPAFYGRLGFLPESRIEPPFPLPVEWAGAWQSQAIGAGTEPGAGKLEVPRPWANAALWAP